MKKIFFIICIILLIPYISCKKQNVMVDMKTTYGTIQLELYTNEAPKTVENFLTYADDRFYEGTIFHRVIDNFMIQGGGFTPDMQQKGTREPIKNEAANGLSNKRGTIAMARTGQIDSATSQFFINVKDNTFLDHSERDYGYCVFGNVKEGMDVVDKIRSAITKTKGPHQNVPEEDIVILSINRKIN